MGRLWLVPAPEHNSQENRCVLTSAPARQGQKTQLIQQSLCQHSSKGVDSGHWALTPGTDSMSAALNNRLSTFIAFAVTTLVVAGSATAQEPPPLVFRVDAFEVVGDNPLDPKATAAALEPFTGEFDGLDGLYAANDALESLLRKRGFIFHRVVLPPQELDRGTVTLKVVTFALGANRVSGNERVSDARAINSLSALTPGIVPNLRNVSRSLAVANEHPGRQYSLNFSRSEDEADTLDANIRVREYRPYSVFSSINNIGTDDSGNLRATMGAEYNDLFSRDHTATFTYSTSPDNADDVRQFGFNYRAPVYRLNGWFQGFYIHSDVDVGNVQQFFDISGSGDFAGLGFRHWLLPFGRYRHSVSLLLQDRRFDSSVDNAVTGVGLPGISTVVRSRPLSLTYQGSYRWARSDVSFAVDLVQNLSWGGNNRDRDYSAVRIGAESEWNAIRFGIGYNHQLPRGWFAVGKVAGQYADEPLIPGEQYGLGGEFTVRGYEERAIAGDDAVLFNFELWTPPIRAAYGMRFFTFADVGFKHLEEPVTPQITSDTISSAGLGFRVNVREYLYVTAAYGHVIAHARGETSDKGNVKTHFNVVLKY